MMATKKMTELSFAGAGFLGVYQIGVARYLQQNFKTGADISRVAGSSSGSIVTCLLLDEYPARLMRAKFRIISEIARKSRLGAFAPEFNVENILKEHLLPDLSDDVLSRVNNRLFISLTKTNKQNLLVNHFHSKEDLVDAIACSCFIPGYSGYTCPKFRGIRYLDGGLSNNLPFLGEDTVYVGSFSGRGKHISPAEDKMNSYPSFDLGGENICLSPKNMIRLSHAGFIADDSVYDEYESQGYSDAKSYFETRNSRR